MSQQRLADAAGVSFQQVQKYEAGTDRLSVSRLCQFATVLEFAPSAFLDGFAPGVGPRDLFDDQLATTEGADLMRAFRAIRSVKLRRRAVSVVEALGDEA